MHNQSKLKLFKITISHEKKIKRFEIYLLVIRNKIIRFNLNSLIQSNQVYKHKKKNVIVFYINYYSQQKKIMIKIFFFLIYLFNLLVCTSQLGILILFFIFDFQQNLIIIYYVWMNNTKMFLINYLIILFDNFNWEAPWVHFVCHFTKQHLLRCQLFQSNTQVLSLSYWPPPLSCKS